MTDLPPPPPPPPPGGWPPPPPGYTAYGAPDLSAALAGFWTRFAAALIDGLILAVPFWILGAITGAYTTTETDVVGNRTESTSFRVGFGFTPGVPMWFNLLNTAVGVCYYGFLEGGPSGQTIGKMALSIRVVDAGTQQPAIGVGRGIGRYFARWLSAIACLLGYLWMLWDPKKQTWHDKLVGTLVVRA